MIEGRNSLRLVAFRPLAMIHWMNDFLAKQTGKVLLLHLDKGEDVMTAITEAAVKNGIQTGIVTSGIGSLRQASYHYIGTTADKPSDEYVTIQKPLELVCLQGIILEGKPHLHALIAEEGSKSHAGHMEVGCIVQYLAEISIVEVADMPLARRAGQYGTVTHFEWLDSSRATE